MPDLKRLTAQIIGMIVVFSLILFGAAGTVGWPAGWLFLTLFFSFVIALSLWLLKYNPALLIERSTGIGKADQKAWDMVFFVLEAIAFVAWLVLMALDAVRFGWSHMPLWLQGLGLALLICSFALFFLTFR